MTPEDLKQTLDAMQQAAEAKPEQMPGLITGQIHDWIERTSEIRTTCKAIHDGLRHREIRIEIGKGQKTQVLTRGEVGC